MIEQEHGKSLSTAHTHTHRYSVMSHIHELIQVFQNLSISLALLSHDTPSLPSHPPCPSALSSLIPFLLGLLNKARESVWDGWMDGWLALSSILSMQLVAISCLRKFIEFISNPARESGGVLSQHNLGHSP